MIGLSVLRPPALLLLALLPLLVLAWRRWPPPLGAGRGRLALVGRLLLVMLLVLALAGVRLSTQPARQALVAVVDVSDSVKGGSGQPDAAGLVRALAAGKGPDDLFGVVTFAHDAAVELPLTREPEIDPGYRFQTQPDPSFTDIAGALRLAAGLVPEGYARHLVLFSDGRQNLGDAAPAVAALRAEGVRVDTYPTGAEPGAEALVAAVDLPSELRLGQTATPTVRLRSSGQASGRLTLIVDDREVASRAVVLPAGSSAQAFELPPLEVGLHRARAELTVQPDTRTENDVGEAAVRVRGQPLVLVLEGREGEGANVESALRSGGIGVERRTAASAPTDTATLGRYDSTVIVDAATDGFPHDSLAAIAASVHDLGKGLVAIGGPTSYGPGGWQGTPLEEALPVRMDIPNRKDKPKVAVVLVMETMEDPRADQLVLSAAEAVIDKLSPDDQVAVTDGRLGFLVDMTPVRDRKAIDARLESANLGDPPSYLPFVQKAVDALARTDAPLKHIVLLGDGDAEESQTAGIHGYLEGALRSGITTSSIAVDVHGQSQFMAYMQDLARWGGGRFYESNNPSQVPQLFLKESLASLRPWFEQDPFLPRLAAAGDLLQGVPTDAFPQLGGYVVTTPKPAAEQYLTSPKQDPVLAGWSYGLGRSVAWTSDSGGLWTAGFLGSPVSAAVYARMVAWTLPPAGGERLQVQARPSGDGLDVIVTGPEASGAGLQVGVVRPDLSNSSQELGAVAPGRWQGRIAGTTIGTYLIHAALRSAGATVAQADAAVSVPYSPEYLELGTDPSLLSEIARAGGGEVLARPARAWNLRPAPAPLHADIFWALVLLTACLWPLDIAIRRITLSPRQLVTNALSLAAERRAQGLEVAVPEELVRLRNRVAAGRREKPRGSPLPAAAGRVPPPPPVPEERPSQAAPPTEAEQLSARLLDARRKRRG